MKTGNQEFGIKLMQFELRKYSDNCINLWNIPFLGMDKFLWLLVFFFNFSAIIAQSTNVYVAPHPDDWQLFMNPNAYTDLKNPNKKVVFLHTTAGDAGDGTGTNFYLAREEGSLRAIRFMSNTFTNGIGSNMNKTTVTINGHKILKFSYRNATAYFLRLPDGNLNGDGYILHNNVSLKKIYDGSKSSISAIDGSTTYNSLNDLEVTIKAIIQSVANPSDELIFNLADDDSSINPGDHSDHIYSSLILQHVAQSIGGVKLNLYTEYSSTSMPQNLFNDNYLINVGTWAVTTSGISDNSRDGTWDNIHNAWIGKQYFRTNLSVIKPEVSITAIDSIAGESPLETGTLKFSLAQINTGPALTINYTVEGTATNGIDYNALSGTTSISNGQQYSLVTIIPINDTEVEPSETVILKLAPGADYIIGNPSKATVNITSEDVAPVGGNIALNKPTSSSLGIETPSLKAVDNDYSLSSWWGANPYPQWWQVDLGALYNLNKIVVVNYYDGSRYYQYDIKASVDGVNWSPLVDFNQNKTPATKSGNTFIINNATARYIRVNMNYNSKNIGVHIVEFEAYGVLNTTSSNNISTLKTQTLIDKDVIGEALIDKDIIGEGEENHTLKIYPNPTQPGSLLNLNINSSNDTYALIEIFNFKGLKLLSEKFNLVQGYNEIEIPIDQFQFLTKMLIVKVNIHGEVITRKIIYNK